MSDLAADRARRNEEMDQALRDGGEVSIHFDPLDHGHSLRIGPEGAFVFSPCSRSGISEVQARAVVTALSAWLDLKAAGDSFTL